MIYGSVCSGIEAATMAWHPLGWRPAFFSEIEPFPSAVLAHHYPTVPNHGDMTRFQEWPHAALDVLVGGTPCQSFSVAGLRKGLDDPRGNLMLTFGAIAKRYRPAWLVWENVPGVLSSNGGRDFGTFLGMLGELGYGFAYRILDAQYFGVAQRRRRVFVVGHLGSWQRAAAVLFESDALSGNPAPSRDAQPELPRAAVRGLALRGRDGGAALEVGDDLGFTLRASQGGGDKPLVMAFHAGQDPDVSGDVTHPLQAQTNGLSAAIGFVPKAPANSRSAGERLEQSPTITTHMNGQGVQQEMVVRRLTPAECEALQGFPRGYTDVGTGDKPAPDGARYKALGNSMAVPCMAWIGERIAEVDAITPSPAPPRELLTDRR